jgi:hypothetical protein
VRFNKHLQFRGEHAFLSPSGYHWINYTPERLVERWAAAQAGANGIIQHEYAKKEIEAGRLSDLSGIIGLYINDCIDFDMVPEQILFYSENCFGTADAIQFKYRHLRIFDLKTGVYPGSVHQLEVYAALFCLEYEQDPFDIEIELRIYQDNEVMIFDADPEDISFIMAKIKEFDQIIDQIRREEES